MPRRSILTERQRRALFDLPSDRSLLLKHYVLSDDDITHINQRRRAQNRLGFALQLCAFRYPGRMLGRAEVIPEAALNFIGAQIGITGEQLERYAARSVTKYQHSAVLQRTYGYCTYEGPAVKQVKVWLESAAEQAFGNVQLANELLAELRKRKIIVPGATTVERRCADALVKAEKNITTRIAARLTPNMKIRLDSLLSETVSGSLTRFVWLRQFEPGSNSADVNRLLDRWELLRTFNLNSSILDDVPSHRVADLRRQGERYFADGMRELPAARKHAILAVCVIEWQAMVADAVLETHDRIVGRIYRAAERQREAAIQDQRKSAGKTLKSFAEIGRALIAAHEENERLEDAILAHGGWPALELLVAQSTSLTKTMQNDPLDFVAGGYHRFRRYAPRLLECFDIKGSGSAASLLDAIALLRDLNRKGTAGVPGGAPINFARPSWRPKLFKNGALVRAVWETAILFELRHGMRSGDIWLPVSRRYQDVENAMVPIVNIRACRELKVPLEPQPWIKGKVAELDSKLQAVSRSLKSGTLPHAIIHNGQLRLEKLEKSVPDGAEDLVLRLYDKLPLTRITDLLLEVDQRIGFAEAFTDLRNGTVCRDRIGILSVILADGINLGLKKMSEACSSHTFWELLRIAKWHVRDETVAQALAMVVEAQSRLPLAQLWGGGETSASDGQHFPAGGAGEALNLVNARYGQNAGLNAYSHVSDQYAPFATQVIPATAHEAPYILDGLLRNDTGRQIKEHYADTGGFTDHVFAACSLLGYRFAPRIRDLPDKRLYVFDPKTAPEVLQPLIGGKIDMRLISESWPEILRLAASMAIGTVVPSQILRKLAAYPRQNKLALALREVGRVERTLFMLDWLSDQSLQRRAQAGLNKGEAHHALKRALGFHRRGEIRDRTSESQHHRIAALNLLAAIVIYWNTSNLGQVVTELAEGGERIDPALLAHVSPLGWEHINLTGEYRWRALG
jgi:TnpA family transposase